jgi:putative transposase
MNIHTQLLYHIVIATRYRYPWIVSPHRHHLYQYIWMLTEKRGCDLVRINGVDDHIHLLVCTPPEWSVATLVGEIKTETAAYIRGRELFTQFNGWQKGFGAFSVSPKEKEQVTDHIRRQQQYHRQVTFIGEYQHLLREYGIPEAAL